VCYLARIAGGSAIFPERAACALGRDRILADPMEVVRRAPELIIGSWCGKKFQPDKVGARPGWSSIPAVRDGLVAEIKSAVILQPGPAAILDGLPILTRLIATAAASAKR